MLSSSRNTSSLESNRRYPWSLRSLTHRQPPKASIRWSDPPHKHKRWTPIAAGWLYMWSMLRLECGGRVCGQTQTSSLSLRLMLAQTVRPSTCSTAQGMQPSHVVVEGCRLDPLPPLSLVSYAGACVFSSVSDSGSWLLILLCTSLFRLSYVRSL